MHLVRTPQTTLLLDRRSVVLLEQVARVLLTTRDACLATLIEQAARELGICDKITEAAALERKQALIRLL